MTDLMRAAAQQALEALEDLADCGAEAWSEQRPCVQIGREAITDLRAALAEPTVKESLQVESAFAENATTQQQLEEAPPSDYRRGYWDGFEIGKREGRIEAENALAEPVQEAVQEPVQEPGCRDDGMPTSAEERHLRRLLALRAAMPHAYYDDGEAQGTEHGIIIDFMREPVAHIDAKLRALNVARAIAKQAEPVQEPAPMPPFPPVSLWKRGCAVCGIGAGGHAYGYACPRSDCPTRVTCGRG